MSRINNRTRFTIRLTTILGLVIFLLCSGMLITDAYATMCLVDAGAPSCDQAADAGSAVPLRSFARHVGNPIDVVTGNKYQRVVDYAAADSPLQFSRHYNSGQVDTDIGLGRGWRHSFATSLARLPSGGFEITQSDGRRILFDHVMENVEDESTGIVVAAHKSRLHGDGFIVPSQGFVWYLPDGRRLHFHGAWLVKIVYPDNQELQLYYQDRQLVRVVGSDGKVLSLSHRPGKAGLARWQGEDDVSGQHVPNGHIINIELPSGAKVRYHYGNELNLVAALDDQGFGERYQYEAETYPNHLTSRVEVSQARAQNVIVNGGNAEGTRLLGRWGYDTRGRADSWSGTESIPGLTIQYAADSDVDATGNSQVQYSNGAVDQFDWTARPDGSGHDVSRASRVVNPEAPQGPAGQARVKPVLAADSESVVPYTTLSNRELNVRVVVDRMGTTVDTRIGNRSYQTFKRALHEGQLEQCLPDSPDNSLEQNIDLWAARASNDPVSRDAAPSCLEDLALLHVMAERAGAQLNVQSFAGIQPRSRQLGQPGPVCPIPAFTNCDDMKESLEHAELARCVYSGNTCDPRWQPVDPASLGFDPSDFSTGSFHAEVFYDAVRDRYTLSFRGTDDGVDWLDNLSNGAGLSSDQYGRAIRLSERVLQRLERRSPGADLVLTGHSLGGGLATAAAIAIDRKAVVFNPAGFHEKTAKWNGLDLDDAGYLVHVIKMTGDPISAVQRASGGLNSLLQQIPGVNSELFSGDAPGYHTQLPKPTAAWLENEKVRREASGEGSQELLILHSMEAIVESTESLIALHCT